MKTFTSVLASERELARLALERESEDSFKAKQKAALEQWAAGVRQFHESIAPQNRWALSSDDVAFLRACGIKP